MLTSFVTEPLLTGLGAGGYMLVAGRRRASRRCSTSSSRRPRARGDGSGGRAATRVDVSFGDAEQVFHIGPASCGVYGDAGRCVRGGARAGAACRSRSSPRPRRGSRARASLLNAGQAYVAEILAELLTSTPECAALWAPGGRVLREGELLRNPELGEALTRLGARRRRAVLPRRHRRRRCATGSRARGGSLDPRGPRRLRGDRARAGARSRYRDREILTNPPPSAGGTLLAYALGAARPRARRRRRCGASSRRWPPRSPSARAEFVEGLDRARASSSASSPSRLGSTTHISVIDADGHGLQRDVHQRRGLGRGRPRHRASTSTT